MIGDLPGYVWGRTDERIEVPICNERERQAIAVVENARTLYRVGIAHNERVSGFYRCHNRPGYCYTK